MSIPVNYLKDGSQLIKEMHIAVSWRLAMCATIVELPVVVKNNLESTH